MKYVCTVCGFVYDEAKGIPEAGIAPGTKWDALPSDWVCPVCGASKSEFKPENVSAETKNIPTTESKFSEQVHADVDMLKLSPLGISAICSNLAKGCEKQYLHEEAGLFTELAAYYKSKAAPEQDKNFADILNLIENDLSGGFPRASTAASGAGDRGAKRSLVWGEKVTKILKSLLSRYEKEGEAMIKDTDVYICTVCGFVYVGGNPPDICPVCKVPGWKFEKIEKGAE